MVLWDTSLPSSQFSGFLNEATIPCPNTSPFDLLVCCAVTSKNLDLVNTRKPKNSQYQFFVGEVYAKAQLFLGNAHQTSTFLINWK